MEKWKHFEHKKASDCSTDPYLLESPTLCAFDRAIIVYRRDAVAAWNGFIQVRGAELGAN